MFHVDAMLVLLCFFAILKSIVSEEMCVVYSFTDDFYRSFSKKECSDDVSWDLVNYSDAGVPLPSNVSVSGIKGRDRSCSTSFELVVYSGSSLELQVFSSGRCGVVVSVLSALQGSDDPVQTKTFEPEDLPEAQWSLVSMEIGSNSSHNGYIKIEASCNDDASFILINSIRYLPTALSKEKCLVYPRNNTPTESNTSIEDGEFLLYDAKRRVADEVSIEADDDTATDSPENVDGGGSSETEARTFWNALTISIVSVVGAAVVSIIFYGAYKCGQVRARDESIDYDIEEPASNVTLPRVRSATDGRNTILGRYDV
ncbi:hypothetical protein JYU34_015965 [Plutella xylostella]|uniref:Uncharacterized protein n=1 Tax=Plutella xylostella TaxID=51655 RepID=A0ABQ7Q6L4_PLUXY|nr:hypothetical protein JYU34_015965 [Plutella xylostella]